MLARLHRAEDSGCVRTAAEPFRWAGDLVSAGAHRLYSSSAKWPNSAAAGLAATGFGEELQAVQKELAELRSQAESRARESYQAGFEAGHRQGLAESQKEVEEFRKQIADSLHSVVVARQETMERADEDLVHLGVAIAEKILHRQVQVDPQALRGLIRSSLERLIGRSVFCVRIHPQDRAAVEAELATKGTAGAFRFVEDPALSRGALLFETDFGVLDCSVSTQLEEIEHGLADQLRRTER